jgi:hypothetical protein
MLEGSSSYITFSSTFSKLEYFNDVEIIIKNNLHGDHSSPFLRKPRVEKNIALVPLNIKINIYFLSSFKETFRQDLKGEKY